VCGQAQARSTDEVLRIAFRAWGGREFAVTMLTPSTEPRDKLEAAALRILATSWPVRGADGEVTVAVPPMMSPARGRTGRPGGAGKAGRGETWRAAPIRFVRRGCALIERRCPCLFEAAGATLAKQHQRDCAFRLARHCRAHLGARQDQPGGCSDEDRPMTGTDRRGSWRRKR
jgi:hypothetical protein